MHYTKLKVRRINGHLTYILFHAHSHKETLPVINPLVPGMENVKIRQFIISCLLRDSCCKDVSLSRRSLQWASGIDGLNILKRLCVFAHALLIKLNVTQAPTSCCFDLRINPFWHGFLCSGQKWIIILYGVYFDPKGFRIGWMKTWEFTIWMFWFPLRVDVNDDIQLNDV